MIVCSSCFLLLLLIATASTCAAQQCDQASGFCSYNPQFDLTQLLAEFPSLLDDNLVGNEQVICPFLRMLVRNKGLSDKHALLFPKVENVKLTHAATRFGMPLLGGAIVLLVSAGQTVLLSTIPGHVNLHKLWNAPPVSHECGLSFAKGGREFDAATTNSTIIKLQARADSNGRVTLADLEMVKLDICAEQGVSLTPAGSQEVELIWGICAGLERGFVEVSDVERFLNGYMPKTIGRVL